jgi:hypothetical protein
LDLKGDLIRGWRAEAALTPGYYLSRLRREDPRSLCFAPSPNPLPEGEEASRTLTEAASDGEGYCATRSMRAGTVRASGRRLLLSVQLRELFAQDLQLRHVVVHDVGFVRVVDQIVLVIALCFKERFQGDHLGCDFGREDFGLV